MKVRGWYLSRLSLWQPWKEVVLSSCTSEDGPFSDVGVYCDVGGRHRDARKLFL